jgi:hypothetical protein
MDRKLKVAWAAGFFDGEGFVGTSKRTSKRGDKVYESLYIRIGINHVAPEPLEEIIFLFGGTLNKQALDKVVGNRKPRHQWKITTDKAVNALREMLPYMKNKQYVASLAIDFQETMECSRTRWSKVPEDILKKRREIREEIIKVNALT